MIASLLSFTAYEMKKWIVPVKLEPCIWHRIKFLENINPLPSIDKFVTELQDKNLALLEISRGIERLAKVIKNDKS